MERAIRSLLLTILLFSFTGVKIDAYIIREDLRSFQVPGSSFTMTGPPIVHPDASGVEYTFLPPRKNQPLHLTLSSTDQIDLHLVLSTGIREFRLPASPDQLAVRLLLPEDSLLYSISITGKAEFSDGSEPLPMPSVTLSVDRPDALVMPVGEFAQAGGELQLGISGQGSILFTPEKPEAGDVPFFISTFSALRNYQFQTRDYISSEWSLSPLEKITSITLKSVPETPFPSPLLRDGGQILDNPPVKWRNRDFEIYSWTPLPEILVFDCFNYEIQNRFFRRLSYYVEKKGYSGTLLTNSQLMNKHGWNAHDYRPADLADFFNLVEHLSFKVYPEEEMLLEILLGHGVLKRDSTGSLVAGKGAVLSISKESTEPLRSRFFTHEASHGLYFVSGEYRQFVRETWDSLNDGDRDMWRFFLGWYGYDPEDEDLMINEFQSYLLQQSPDMAPGYFAPRMASLAVSYPLQKEMLNRRTGQASVVFRDWAEQLAGWIDEKWGLEAGNFSTLRKELH